YAAHQHVPSFPPRRSSDLTSVFVTKTTFNDTVTYLLDQMQNSGNNYPTDVDFDISTGWLSIGRNGLPRISTSLDGRYIQRSELRSEEHTSELQSRENLVCR